jgi:hypothetical protein
MSEALAPTPEMIAAGVDVMKGACPTPGPRRVIGWIEDGWDIDELAKRVFLAMSAARERSPAQ